MAFISNTRTEKTFTVESEATEIIIEIGVTGMDISTFTPVTLTNFHILPKLERVYESNYESNAEDINVTVSGKNLFNPNLLLTTPSGTATGWKYENGYYYGSSGALRSYYNDGVSTYECPLVSGWFKENTQYTLSFKVYTATEDTSSTIGFYFKYSDGKNIYS